MTYTGISIKEETKARFDKIQRTLSFVKNKDVSQDETFSEILDVYEQVTKVKA